MTLSLGIPKNFFASVLQLGIAEAALFRKTIPHCHTSTYGKRHGFMYVYILHLLYEWGGLYTSKDGGQGYAMNAHA